MVNNTENERESSPPKAAKERGNRLPPILNTPVVPDNSYMTPGYVPGGNDFDTTLNVVKGPAAMHSREAQIARSKYNGNYDNDDDDVDDDYVDDNYVNDADYAASNAAKFARGRKVAPSTTAFAEANLPENYRFGQSSYPAGTSVQARKKLAATKNSGNQSSEADPSSTIAAAGTNTAGNTAGNTASPDTTSSSITAAGSKLAGNASPETTTADTITVAGPKLFSSTPSGSKSSATKLSDTTSKYPKSVGNKSATSKSSGTSSSNLKPAVRYSQSCTPCRRRKGKCVQVEGQDRCEFCEEKNKACFYEPTSKKITKLRPGEDDSLPPTSTKNVRFAADTKNASEDVKMTGDTTNPAGPANPKRKSGQAQKKKTGNINMTGTTSTTPSSSFSSPSSSTTPVAATTITIGDNSSSDLEMTGQEPTAQGAAPAPALAQEPAHPGMGFFDNSGNFTKYEEAADGDDAGFFNYNPVDEADQASYLDLNSAGDLLDQFEYERAAWPDEAHQEEDYSHFLDPVAAAAAAPPQAPTPTSQPAAEAAAGAAAAQAGGPHHAQLAFREAPTTTTAATAATAANTPAAGGIEVPFPDLTANIPHELPAEFALPGTPAYDYSCAKVQYMCEKMLADNLRAAVQAGDNGGGAAEELARQERVVEALRLEAIELWEAANAAEPAGKVHDPVGIQFLRSFAPQ